MIRSSFGAILMLHCSHQILNSGSETAAFEAFILAPDLEFSDSWILSLHCNRLDGGIPVPCRSGRVFAVWTVRLHLHFDPARKGLVHGICDTAHRDNVVNRTWTIEKCSLADHLRFDIVVQVQKLLTVCVRRLRTSRADSLNLCRPGLRLCL